MRTFKCVNSCHGYKRRFWNVGETVSVGDDEENPPRHFVEVNGDAPVEVKIEEPMSLASMSRQPVITTGMATGLQGPQTDAPGQPPKRGRPKK